MKLIKATLSNNLEAIRLITEVIQQSQRTLPLPVDLKTSNFKRVDAIEEKSFRHLFTHNILSAKNALNILNCFTQDNIAEDQVAFMRFLLQFLDPAFLDHEIDRIAGTRIMCHQLFKAANRDIAAECMQVLINNLSPNREDQERLKTLLLYHCVRLSVAIQNYPVEHAVKLLQLGATPRSVRDDKVFTKATTMLADALGYHDLSLAQLLIEHGADPANEKNVFYPETDKSMENILQSERFVPGALLMLTHGASPKSHEDLTFVLVQALQGDSRLLEACLQRLQQRADDKKLINFINASLRQILQLCDKHYFVTPPTQLIPRLLQATQRPYLELYDVVVLQDIYDHVSQINAQDPLTNAQHCFFFHPEFLGCVLLLTASGYPLTRDGHFLKQVCRFHKVFGTFDAGISRAWLVDYPTLAAVRNTCCTFFTCNTDFFNGGPLNKLQKLFQQLLSICTSDLPRAEKLLHCDQAVHALLVASHQPASLPFSTNSIDPNSSLAHLITNLHLRLGSQEISADFMANKLTPQELINLRATVIEQLAARIEQAQPDHDHRNAEGQLNSNNSLK